MHTRPRSSGHDTHSHDHHGHAHAHEPSRAPSTQAHGMSHHHPRRRHTARHCGHSHLPGADGRRGRVVVAACDDAWLSRSASGPAPGRSACCSSPTGLGLMWAGVVSTFVMAIGTAITVSALAALAAGSRDAATKLAGIADNSWAARAQTAFGLARRAARVRARLGVLLLLADGADAVLRHASWPQSRPTRCSAC